MLSLIFAAIVLQGPADQIKQARTPMLGQWKVDLATGYPLKMTQLGLNVDWIITFADDGTFTWTVYEPFVEGKGRRSRSTKGTYIVNPDANLLVIRTTQLTSKLTSFKCVLSEDKKAFTIPSLDPENKPELKIRFTKIEVPKIGTLQAS